MRNRAGPPRHADCFLGHLKEKHLLTKACEMNSLPILTACSLWLNQAADLLSWKCGRQLLNWRNQKWLGSTVLSPAISLIAYCSVLWPTFLHGYLLAPNISSPTVTSESLALLFIHLRLLRSSPGHARNTPTAAPALSNLQGSSLCTQCSLMLSQSSFFLTFHLEIVRTC